MNECLPVDRAFPRDRDKITVILFLVIKYKVTYTMRSEILDHIQ